MTFRFVDSGRAQIACDDVGQGPAVVFLHAGVADRRCWASTASALADRYRLVAIDRRGFGETTYEPEPHDHAADVVAVLDALNVDRAVVVGNSMGGRVAIELALPSADRVLALVLIGSAVRGAPAPEHLPADVAALFDRLDEIDEAGDLTR